MRIENLKKELKQIEKMLLTATRVEANMLYAREVEIKLEISRNCKAVKAA